MLQIPYDAVVPMEKFTEYFRESPRVYVDVDMVESELASTLARCKSRYNQLRDMMYSSLGFIPNDLSKMYIIKYLDKNGVPEKYYTNRISKNDSYDKKAKQKMIEDGYCVDFNVMHMEFSSLKHYLSHATKLVASIKRFRRVEGNNGEQLVEVPYEVSLIHNRRFSTANANVIGFYGTLKSAMKVPKGYVMVGGDFPQIDGRGALHLYFKTKKMLEIARTTPEDYYLVYKELVRHVEHMRDEYRLANVMNSDEYADTSAIEKRISKFDPSVQPFASKNHRGVYKVIALRTVYNSQSSPMAEIDHAIKKLSNVLNVTGRYAAYKEIAKYLHEIGYPIVAKSRLGYKRHILDKSQFDMLAKLFNTPIQATSSEIIIIFITAILDYFRDLGYGTDDIKIYVNRHDEPIFQIREEVFAEHAEFFKYISTILVHGWLPFTIKWNVGHSYGDDSHPLQSLLDSYSSDRKAADELAEQYLDSPEPVIMEIPEMLALSYRILPDGTVLFLVTRQIGDMPMDEYYFNVYQDTRTVEYALIRPRLDGGKISFNDIMVATQELLKGLDTKPTYLLLLDNRGQESRQYSLGEYSVFVCGYRHPLHELNKVIIGSTMCNTFPDVATNEDKHYARSAPYYSKRLVHRKLR